MAPKGRSNRRSKNEQVSVNFPFLEAFIEREPVELGPYQKSHARLQKMINSDSVSPRLRGAAEQAIVAYDNFFSLIEHLLSIKVRLQKGQRRFR